MSEMLPYKPSDFGGVPDKNFSSKSFQSREGGDIGKETNLYGTGVWGGLRCVKSFCSELSEYQDNMAEDGFVLSSYNGELEAPVSSAFGHLDGLYFYPASPPFQSCQEDILKNVNIKSEIPMVIEPQKNMSSTFPSASLAILNSYRSRFKLLNGKKIDVPSYNTACTNLKGQKLSTDTIIRLGGERFIQSCSQSVDDLTGLGHPYASLFSGLSIEEIRDVELIEYLLATAEKVGQQHFGRASKLLHRCRELSSNKGNPIQRIVYYFVEAFREKIDLETGRFTSNCLGKKQALDLEEIVMNSSRINVAFLQEVPFAQVSQFTGTQAIVENVAQAKRVHMVDLEIMNGSHCIALMQALAGRHESPLEHLKITALGTKSKQKLEETGKRLMSFAQSVNFSFSFKIVMVADILDLSADLFEMDAEETVAVYSSYSLAAMIAQPDRLECLLRVIGMINPCVMVIIEVEAKINSRVFVNRFLEALFYYGAIFDSLGDCMDNADPSRMILESVYYSPAIRSIVSVEGEERTVRQVNMTVWRAFFARFGMVELELSMPSLYQASLVLKNFTHGSSCTLDMDGKCLIIGWKGTPIQSVSTWKFV